MPRNRKTKKKRTSSCPKGWLPAGTSIPVRLTKRQEAYCRRAIGIARFCYNLAVATHRFHRTNRLRPPSWMDINKEFNAVKKADYPFATQVASRVAEGAFMDFGRALANWNNRNLKARAPTLKKKKATGTGSFRAASGTDQLGYNGKRRIQLPGLGSVKLACTLPKGIPHEARIKRENGRWMLSVQYWREPEPKPKPDHRRRGAVDVGINPLATDSDGDVFPNPRAYYSQERKLRRWQRAQSRRKKGSRGWWEAQRKIDKCHRRIKGLRRNAAHQMTNTVTRKFKHLVIEDLNVSAMMQGPTPKAQADSAMGEIRRQLEYKCRWRYTSLIKAHRLFPSSKICHVCQHPNAKLKRERWWTCPTCRAGHERNRNAAANLGRLILPPGRGPMLRDGRALAGAPNAGETSPVERRTAQLTLWS